MNQKKGELVSTVTDQRQPIMNYGRTPTQAYIERCARVCHEANRALCLTYGDTSHAPWDDAPEWQRSSAMAGVKFRFENPQASAEDSHNRWMEQKLREGWGYGEVKDPANKRHPCLLPYCALPESEKIKDSLFAAICDVFRERMMAICDALEAREAAKV